jgi:hypothetical protein
VSGLSPGPSLIFLACAATPATTIDFSSDKQTSALKRSATDFLNIPYPSIDLLKVFEATQPDKSRPVVLLGARGLGKSHLLAAEWHAMNEPEVAKKWLADWSVRLGRPELNNNQLAAWSHVRTRALQIEKLCVADKVAPTTPHIETVIL